MNHTVVNGMRWLKLFILATLLVSILATWILSGNVDLYGQQQQQDGCISYQHGYQFVTSCDK